MRSGLRSLPFDVSLRDALGGRLVVLPKDCERFAIAGVAPQVVVSPRSFDEAARAVTTLARDGASVVVRGAGTKSNRPPAPAAVDAVLDMSGVSGVIEYNPGDLTATVRAGTTLSELQRVLAEHGQFFACDAPFARRATLGGTLAAHASGPMRLRYGTPRDLVIGARLISADGKSAFCGSKVVKSVAGYDLHKLLIGSWGTLGVIGEVTLKTAPLPRFQRLLAAQFANCEDACTAALAVARSNLFVQALSVHDQRAARRVRGLAASGWTLLIRCAGTKAAVNRQSASVSDLCRDAGARGCTELEASQLDQAWDDVRELAGGEHYPAADWIVWKVVGLPSQVSEIFRTVADVWPDAELTAHGAAGVVYCNVPARASMFVAEQAAALWQAFARTGWHAVALSVPPRLGFTQPPLHPDVPVGPIRAIKAAFDPEGVFDPGRFVGGV